MSDVSSTSVVTVATGLGWPEGPTVLPDGRIVLVESYRSQLTAIDGNGSAQAASPMSPERPIPACSVPTARFMSARTAAQPDLGAPPR